MYNTIANIISYVPNLGWDILFAFGLIIIILVLFGLIGPQWVKNLMRRYQRWYHGEGQVFLPMDPYKPLGPALKEAWTNRWPEREQRFFPWLFPNFHSTKLKFLILIITGVILYIVFQTDLIVRLVSYFADK